MGICNSCTCTSSQHHVEHTSYANDPDAQWLLREFYRSNVDNRGLLSRHDATNLLHQLQIYSPEEVIRYYLSDNDKLNADDFIALFFNLQNRRELSGLYEHYAQQSFGTRGLSFGQMHTFLNAEQKEYPVNGDIQEHLTNTFGAHLVRSPLYHDDFSRLLTSPQNSWTNPFFGKTWQDSTQPLTSYFINSSHNTYLTGHQLHSSSRLEMYKHCLLSGCRCVEVDCWDGSSGMPIVYHGRTLTSKLKFADVIDCINQYAFQASEFPVIISLEVHCSLPQQAIMANIMHETFGEALVLPGELSDPWSASPFSLSGRIILKGRTRSLAPADDPDEDKQEVGKPVESVAEELARVIYMAAVKCHSLSERLATAQPHEVTSFAEYKGLGFLASGGPQVTELNKKCFTRIYPHGTRVDSSNYDPTVFWGAGCQLVALNWQKNDFNMRLNHAFFQRNGNCGIVLKPMYLSTPGTTLPPPQRLKITVISAHNLPPPEELRRLPLPNPGWFKKLLGAGGIHKAHVDPYVEVSVRDAGEEWTHRTRIIRDETWNPIWRETFEFAVKNTEIAMITLRVLDCQRPEKNVQYIDQIIGEAIAPVHDLVQGYRIVPLVTPHDNKPLPHSHVLVNIEITEFLLTTDDVVLTEIPPTQQYNMYSSNPTQFYSYGAPPPTHAPQPPPATYNDYSSYNYNNDFLYAQDGQPRQWSSGFYPHMQQPPPQFTPQYEPYNSGGRYW